MDSQADCERTPAYPEPRASLLWRSHDPECRPLTDAERQRNRELLDRAARAPAQRPAS